MKAEFEYIKSPNYKVTLNEMTCDSLWEVHYHEKLGRANLHRSFEGHGNPIHCGLGIPDSLSIFALPISNPVS